MAHGGAGRGGSSARALGTPPGRLFGGQHGHSLLSGGDFARVATKLTGDKKIGLCDLLHNGGRRRYANRSSFWPQEPYPKGGPPMRLITFILFSGIALTWIPACASAQSLQPGIPPGMWVAHCPKNEGDTVCARDAVPIAQASRPVPSQRAYGSLWWPGRAQNTARRPANQKPNRNR